jgi:hypothetical protein
MFYNTNLDDYMRINHDDKKYAYNDAIECALICVEREIGSLVFCIGYSDSSDDVIEDKIKELREVKKEIENFKTE